MIAQKAISLGLFNFNLPFKAQSGHVPASDLATRLSDVLAILLRFWGDPEREVPSHGVLELEVLSSCTPPSKRSWSWWPQLHDHILFPCRKQATKQANLLGPLAMRETHVMIALAAMHRHLIGWWHWIGCEMDASLVGDFLGATDAKVCGY